MKKLLLLFAILLGLNTMAQNTDPNPVDVTNLFTQPCENTTCILAIGSGVATHIYNENNVVIGFTYECEGYSTQTLNLSGNGLLEVNSEWDAIYIFNADLVIPTGVVLITNGVLIFDNDCSSQIITQGTAQVFETMEDYNETLSIEQFIFQNPQLSYRVYDITGKDLGVERKGLKPGVYIIRFENGYTKKFISK